MQNSLSSWSITYFDTYALHWGVRSSKDTEQQGFIALSLLGDDAIRVSTAPGNLLEFDIPPGNTGNLKFYWSYWKIFMTRQRHFLHHVGLIAG